MHRRVVSFILLPFILLTQSVGFCHGHGGKEPRGHEIRPHFHASPAPARPKSDRGHHHGHGGHHHPHDDGAPLPESETQPTPDHDSDAFFFTWNDVVVNEPAGVEGSGAGCTLGVAAGFNPTFTLLSKSPNQAVNWTHAPPGYACALYVRHLSLLI